MGFNFINSIWSTIILLSVLVMVHEFGHFITARLFGVTVHEFSVGFGPLIGKFNRNGIQYSFRWFLLGGFVKIAGMDIALEGEADNQGVAPDRSYQNLSLGKKIAVVAAGPLCNVILAMVLIFFTATMIGFPSSLKNDAPVILQAAPAMPAFDAGIRPGDRVTSINNQPVRKWTDISDLIQKYGKKPLRVKILRRGQALEKTITPIYSPVDKRYQIGINAYPRLQRTSVAEATKVAFTYPWDFTKQVVKAFGMMFRGEVKGGLMGPIGMVTVIEQYLELPIEYLLFFVFSSAISISMFLFLFNMLPLPLPLLDGGWIVILLLEKTFRHEFSAEQKAAAQMVGLVAVLLLGAWVAYGDILRIFRRFF